MEDAPRDGTEIMGIYDGYESPIRWADTRTCMMAGIAGGHGYFGPGWECAENHLIVENPIGWRPIEEPKK